MLRQAVSKPLRKTREYAYNGCMARKKIAGKRTVWYHLKIYFISLFIGMAILMFGGFFNPRFTCANSITCKSDLVTRVDNDVIALFQGRKIIPPKVNLAQSMADSAVLGVRVSNSKKHIYVDLSKQTLYAYEGANQILKTFISSGKWGRTPTGNFNVWLKLPVTRMAGGQGADAYDLPNVQWVMYFYNDFGTHTAYWHNNFGHPMSHGCVNMRLIDAKALFTWADGPSKEEKGTPVSVCDQFKEPGTCVQKNPIN